MPDVSLAELEKGFTKGKDAPTAESIISEFFSGKNIEYKTEIPRPLAMSVLDSMSDLIEEEFGKDNASFLKGLLRYYRVNMVSHKRKSRYEVIQGLRAGGGIIEQEQKRISEKLLGR